MQDEKIFDDIVARLRATRKFGWVQWDTPDSERPNQGATILIKRVDARVDERYSTMDEDERMVRYAIDLRYSSPDSDRLKRRILNYEGLVLNTLNYQSFADLTLPQKTSCGMTREPKEPVASGTRAVIIDASFSYIVPRGVAYTVRLVD